MLVSPISSGGMATVYLARAPHLPEPYRTVAVKVVRVHAAGFDAVAQEFLEEAKLTARIQHPNVVKVLDSGQTPEGLFLVMEYVSGDTLAGLNEAARSGVLPLSPAVGLRVLAEALDGLHAAHQLRDEHGELLGLVHRDFTPHNILIGKDGRVRLTDFGIAKAGNRVSMTRAGLIKGKVSYMSPEQVQGKDMDRRCDVWAAGVIAWEILAGRALFDSDDELRTMFQIATEAPLRLSAVKPELAGPLEEVIARALARDPRARWETAKAFRDALEEALEAAQKTGLASTRAIAAHLRAIPQRDAVTDPAGELTTLEAPEGSRFGKRGLGAGVALVLALGAGAAVRMSHPRKVAVAARVPVSPGVVPEDVPPATLAALPARTESPAEGPARQAVLELYANARIIRIRLNARSVTPARPGAHLKIQVTPSELRGRTHLEAFSEDGRVSRLTLAPGATVAQLQFPSPRLLAPPAVKDEPAPRKTPSLAENPYEKK